MTQRDLFGEPGLEPAQQAVAREIREQRRQLQRVAGAIAGLILVACEMRLKQGRSIMRMEELVADIRALRKVKESSVDRIFRLLRQEGHLNYRVLDRDASLYELLEVRS